jgi:hypothetical protein
MAMRTIKQSSSSGRRTRQIRRTKNLAACGAVVASCMSLGVFAASASPAPGPSASHPPGINPHLVGTYDVTLTLNLNLPTCGFNSGTYTGQMTLNGDGSWMSSGFPGSLGGSWIELGKSSVALSDVDTTSCGHGSSGGSYVATVTKTATGTYDFGSTTKPGILNSPYNWNGTWTASQT